MNTLVCFFSTIYYVVIRYLLRQKEPEVTIHRICTVKAINSLLSPNIIPSSFHLYSGKAEDQQVKMT